MAGFGVPDSRPMVIEFPDGTPRCSWVLETNLDLIGYHDEEWGTPTRDVAVLFEALCLTYFENGLSWATVFGKRSAFRRAFRGFDPHQVAAMSEPDVERLLTDRSIVRNRAKIDATVTNARLIADATNSFVELVWSSAPPEQPILRTRADGRMHSPESVQLSARLKELGYRFVGPVVVHSFMQTVGVENGHFAGCFRAVRACD